MPETGTLYNINSINGFNMSNSEIKPGAVIPEMEQPIDKYPWYSSRDLQIPNYRITSKDFKDQFQKLINPIWLKSATEQLTNDTQLKFHQVYGIGIPCTPEAHGITANKITRREKMKKQNFKVGDRIHTGEGSNIYTIVTIGVDLMYYSSGAEGDIVYRASKDINGNWTNGRDVFFKHGEKPEGLNFLVKGHVPMLVVKIGCKEIPVKGINKLAKKLLSIAKSSASVGSDIVTYFKGDSYSVEDVENAIKWLKENKITS